MASLVKTLSSPVFVAIVHRTTLASREATYSDRRHGASGGLGRSEPRPGCGSLSLLGSAASVARRLRRKIGIQGGVAAGRGAVAAAAAARST